MIRVLGIAVCAVMIVGCAPVRTASVADKTVPRKAVHHRPHHDAAPRPMVRSRPGAVTPAVESPPSIEPPIAAPVPVTPPPVIVETPIATPPLRKPAPPPARAWWQKSWDWLRTH